MPDTVLVVRGYSSKGNTKILAVIGRVGDYKQDK